MSKSSNSDALGLRFGPKPPSTKTPMPLVPWTPENYIKVACNAGLHAIYPNLTRETFRPLDDQNNPNPAYNRKLHIAMSRELDETATGPFERKIFMAPQVQREYEARVPGIMPLLVMPENLGVLHALQQSPDLKENVLQALERPWWFAEVKATPQLLRRMIEKPSVMSEIVPPTVSADPQGAQNKSLKSMVLGRMGKGEEPAAFAARMEREVAAYYGAMIQLQGWQRKLSINNGAIAELRANNPPDYLDRSPEIARHLAMLHAEAAEVDSMIIKARALCADSTEQLAGVRAANPAIKPSFVLTTGLENEQALNKIRTLDSASMARLKVPASLMTLVTPTVSDLSLRVTDGEQHGALKSMQLRHKRRKETPDAQYTRLSAKVAVFQRAIDGLNDDMTRTRSGLEAQYTLLGSNIRMCNDPARATEATQAAKDARSAAIASLHAQIDKLETSRTKMTSLRDHAQHEMDIVQSLHPGRTWLPSHAAPTAGQVAQALKKAEKLPLDQAMRNSDLKIVWLETQDLAPKELTADEILKEYDKALDKMGSWVDPQTLQFNRNDLSTFAKLLDKEAFPQLPDSAPPQLKALRTHISAHLWEINQAANKTPPLSEAEFGYAVRDQFAAIAEKSAVLYKSFRGTPTLRFANILIGKDIVVPTCRDAKMAALYSLLTETAGELKRRALKETAVAGYDDIAKKQVAALRADVPNLAETVAGTNFSTATGVNSAVHNFLGFLNLELGYAEGFIGLRDDSDESVFFQARSPHVKLGLGHDIDSLNAFGKWSYSASLKFDQEGGGLFLVTDHLEPCLKLLQNWRANKAWQTSCSPSARKFMDALGQAYNETTKDVGMRLHDTASAGPNWLADSKIKKGYNDPRLLRLADAVERHLETDTPKISRLITKAFPPVHDAIKQAVENDTALPKDSLREAVPDAIVKGRGKMPYRHTAVTLDGRLGGAIGPKGKAQFGIGIGSQLAGDRMQFHVQTLDAGHDLLNTGYHMDVTETFILHKQIDALLHDQDGNLRVNPPKLHLYSGIKKKFEADPKAAAPDFHGKPDQFDYYIGRQPETGKVGLEAEIPRQFWATIANPAKAKLNDAVLACKSLSHTYADFVECTGKFLYSSPTVSKRDASPALEEVRAREVADKEAAFNAINAAVWNNSYPGGMQAAMKKPELFIAQTHDAISLALGCAGTHLSILQREVVRAFHADDGVAKATGDPEVMRLRQGSKDALSADIRRANDSYDQCRKILENGYLGMRKEVVVDKGTLKNVAVWERYNALIQSSATASSGFNPLSPMLEHGKIMGDWEAGNELGQVALSAKLRYQNATRQVDPHRLGDFFELTLTANAGFPLSEKAVTKMVTKAMEQMYPGATAADLGIHTASLARDVMQCAFAARTGGTSIVIKWHRLPDMPAQPANGLLDKAKTFRKAFDLQFIRVLENKNTGLSVVAPLGGGISGAASHDEPGNLRIAFPAVAGSVKLGVIANEGRQSSRFEIKGADLSYQIMQFGQFREILDQMKADPEKGRPAARSLEEVLLGKRDATGAILEPASLQAQMAGTGYFGGAGTISMVVDRYIAYQTSMANQGNIAANVPAEERNEYYKFYETEPYNRAGRVARQVKHYSAGSQDDPFVTPASFRDEARKTYAKTVGAIDAAGAPAPTFDWAAERAHIAGLTTVQERIAYFSADPTGAVGGHGREVLKMFEEIVGATKEISGAAVKHVPKKHYGLWTKLSDKTERAEAERALDMENEKVADQVPHRLR